MTLSPRERAMALHKKSWAVIDRPYSLGFATVGALYERPRYISCAKLRAARQPAGRRTGWRVQVSSNLEPSPLLEASPYRARASRPLPEGEGDSSEFQFRAQEDLSRVGEQRCCVLTKCRTAHHRHRILKIPVIPEVHKIPTDLKLPVLFEADLLQQADIPVLEGWPTECVATEISTAGHRVRQDSVWAAGRCYDSSSVDRNHERTQIAGRWVLHEHSSRIVIWPAREGVCKSSHSVHSRTNGERLTRLSLGETGNLPPAKDSSQCLVCSAGRKPRHFVQIVQRETMGTVESRTAPLISVVEEVLRHLRA